jgi:hypothetical protein
MRGVYCVTGQGRKSCAEVFKVSCLIAMERDSKSAASVAQTRMYDNG